MNLCALDPQEQKTIRTALACAASELIVDSWRCALTLRAAAPMASTPAPGARRAVRHHRAGNASVRAAGLAHSARRLAVVLPERRTPAGDCRATVEVWEGSRDAEQLGYQRPPVDM
ncbi:hypothetical protein STRTUCAR8_10137 [Streptomyces turgidiscabies Car8]|uniref:Uncharacterized protein n=1 Tax=Streptomyces turgidiscabies (strain Car8) TaxID=698760 RepID=L7FHI8_STRT8|nr:hypothetical protein STRTUCAR8_10137 [Streptomyces turgidiscabies Car8]